MFILAGAVVDALDNRGLTPLHWGVLNWSGFYYCFGEEIPPEARVPCVQALLYAGADPSIKDHTGRTPLESLRREDVRIDEEGIRLLEEAFKISRRPEKLNIRPKVNPIPSLHDITTHYFMGKKEFTSGLFYRTKLPVEVSEKFESAAMKILMPIGF